jgi:hypothetical protein
MFSFIKIQVSFNSTAILATVAIIDLGESLKMVEEELKKGQEIIYKRKFIISY